MSNPLVNHPEYLLARYFRWHMRNDFTGDQLPGAVEARVRAVCAESTPAEIELYAEVLRRISRPSDLPLEHFEQLRRPTPPDSETAARRPTK